MIFADTNILLRSLQTNDPHYPITENALARLRGRPEVLCIAPQNIVEFWPVATRSQIENGLGMSSAKASMEMEITSMLRLFRLLAHASLLSGHAKFQNNSTPCV